MNKKITFIIPAAGNSTRFGKSDKVFYKLDNEKTILENTIDKIEKISRQIIIVLNNNNYIPSKNLFKNKKYFKKITFIKQSKVKGTAIAIRDALKIIEEKIVGVIWSDQIGLSKKTIKFCIHKFDSRKMHIIVPINFSNNCYTNVVLNENNNVKDIRNRSNSKKIMKKGFNDCGFFIFNKKKIFKQLNKNIKNNNLLNFKSEYDFLNLFKNLNEKNSTSIISKEKKDILGINTKKDINKFK